MASNNIPSLIRFEQYYFLLFFRRIFAQKYYNEAPYLCNKKQYLEKCNTTTGSRTWLSKFPNTCGFLFLLWHLFYKYRNEHNVVEQFILTSICPIIPYIGTGMTLWK